MAIDISNDKRKFIQNLYANNKLDPRSEEQLNAILEYELSKESENPGTYNFEESAMAEFKAKHEVDKVLEKVTVTDSKITDTIKEDDFKLDEKSFVEKARKVYPDFKFKKARFGRDSFRVTNPEGKSKVINLNTQAVSSGDMQLDKEDISYIGSNPTASQQFNKFIKEGESIPKKSKKSHIFNKTGLANDELSLIHI